VSSRQLSSTTTFASLVVTAVSFVYSSRHEAHAVEKLLRSYCEWVESGYGAHTMNERMQERIIGKDRFNRHGTCATQLSCDVLITITILHTKHKTTLSHDFTLQSYACISREPSSGSESAGQRIASVRL
jgi:hypothetical protein